MSNTSVKTSSHKRDGILEFFVGSEFLLGCPVSKSCPSHLKCIGSETSQTLESCVSSGKFSLHLHFKLRSCCRYPRVQSLSFLPLRVHLRLYVALLTVLGESAAAQ